MWGMTVHRDGDAASRSFNVVRQRPPGASLPDLWARSFRTVSTRRGTLTDRDPSIPPTRIVVAVIVQWRGLVALFRRSQAVRHDQGLWHCITGYVEPGTL